MPRRPPKLEPTDVPMPAVYFRIFLREYGKRSELRARILEGTGVTEAHLADASAEITLRQQVIQIRNLTRLLGEGWWLAIGRLLEPPAHSAVGAAVISAPTLRETLDVIARYAHVNTPNYRLRLRHEGEDLCLVMDETIRLAEADRVAVLGMEMIAFQRALEIVLGYAPDGTRIRFAHPAPAYGARYAAELKAEVRFDAPATQLVIPHRYLDAPSPYSSASMYRAAVSQLDVLAQRLEAPSFFPTRVAQVVAAGGDAGASLAEAAHRLHMSRRTLIRRLAETGSSYREIRDAHRRARAQHLLRNADLSIADVAARVGYEDQSNFARACRRWFGAAPSGVRKAAPEAAG